MNLLNKSLLGAAVVALITTSSAHAQLLNSNGNLEVNGPLYSGSSYADQTVIGWGYNSNILGEGSPFNTYLTDADNYQIYQVSSAGKTGSFSGPTVVQINGNGNKGYTLESAASLATIAHGMNYTLTLAIANDGGGAGNVTLSLFSATSAPNTNDYSSIPYPGGGFYPAPPNPVSLPIITTGTIWASGTQQYYTINAQAVGDFVDYSISFDTYGSDNSAAVGQNLFLGVNATGYGSLQFDNVRLLAETPEPSTWALMLAGVAGLFFYGRRKLKA